MHALSPARPVAPPSSPTAVVGASPQQMELLNACRLKAMACRSLGRAELFQACAMLSANRAAARAAYLETLVRCLPQAMGRTPRFHRPGAHELTFDEAWLMRILDAMLRKDGASFEFLLRSRIDRLARRNLVFLLCRISEQSELHENLRSLS